MKLKLWNRYDIEALAKMIIFLLVLFLIVLAWTATNGQQVNKKIPLSPMQFGAKGGTETLTQLGYTKTQSDSIFGKGVWDGTRTADWNAINAMFRYMEKNDMHYCIMLSPRGVLNPLATINLPNNGRYDLVWWVIEGAGAKIYFDSTGFQAKVKDQSQAANEATSNSYDIQHLILNGKGKGTAIWLQAPYTNYIAKNKISGFDYGIRLNFCLNSVVEMNMCWGINEIEVSFDTGEGLWSGANDNNSQSNNSSLNHHRSYGNGKMKAAVYVHNSSTIDITSGIFEGGGGDYAVWVDGKYSSFLKSIDINIMHIEQTYKKAAIFIEGKDGKYNVRQIYSQYPNTLIDAKSTGYITVNVTQSLYVHAQSKFAMSGTTKWEGVAWNFTDNCFSNSVSTIKDAKWWKSDATHFQPVFAPSWQFTPNPVWLQPNDHNRGNEWKVWETKGIYN